MTNEEKTKELVQKWCNNKYFARDVYNAVMEMAKWKDDQHPQRMRGMTNEEKAREIIGGGCNKKGCRECGGSLSVAEGCVEFRHLKEMAEWKEKQMIELWNVTRNVYEAWMGGTMNDVRECMKDL